MVQSRTHFGYPVEQSLAENRVHKKITVPDLPYHRDYELQAYHLSAFTASLNSHPILQQTQEIYTCTSRVPNSLTGVYGFAPVYNDFVNNRHPHVEFEGTCFDYTVEFEQIDFGHFDLHITTANRRSETCYDNIWFANTEMHHVEGFYFAGQHTLSFTVPGNGRIDMEYGGLKIFHYCGGFG